MNIAFGKLGKVVAFNQDKWSMKGGDHDAPQYLSALSSMYPQHTFYIISPNDFGKLSMEALKRWFPNHNVVDAFNKIKTKDQKLRYLNPLNYVRDNDIRIDFGLILSGPVGQVNIPNAAYKLTDSSSIAKVIQMSLLYTAPVAHFLNQTGIPYAEIGEDPRYTFCQARDLINRKAVCMSTRKETSKTRKVLKEYLSKELPVLMTTQVFNAGVDKWFLACENQRDRLTSPGDRGEMIGVYSNGFTSSGAIDKYTAVKSYLFDEFSEDEATIYGDWDTNPSITDDEKSRFVKNIPMVELHDQMLNLKYTLMISVKNGYPSSKLYKHLLYGMIPFIHESSLEAYPDVPNYLKCRSAKEFHQKIRELEANPSMYQELWKECQKMLKPEYFNGDFIASQLSKYLSPKAFGSHKNIDIDYSCLPKMGTTHNSLF